MSSKEAQAKRTAPAVAADKSVRKGSPVVSPKKGDRPRSAAKAQQGTSSDQSKTDSLSQNGAQDAESGTADAPPGKGNTISPEFLTHSFVAASTGTKKPDLFLTSASHQVQQPVSDILMRGVTTHLRERQPYVPYHFARDCIARMMDDMNLMKDNHFKVIVEIEQTFKKIETNSQDQFNTFVVGLKDKYGGQVAALRRLLESGAIMERTGNQKETMDSLREQNNRLMDEKKELLEQLIEKDKADQDLSRAVAADDKEAKKLKKQLQEQEKKHIDMERKLLHAATQVKDLQKKLKDKLVASGGLSEV